MPTLPSPSTEPPQLRVDAQVCVVSVGKRYLKPVPTVDSFLSVEICVLCGSDNRSFKKFTLFSTHLLLNPPKLRAPAQWAPSPVKPLGICLLGHPPGYSPHPPLGRLVVCMQTPGFLPPFCGHPLPLPLGLGECTPRGLREKGTWRGVAAPPPGGALLLSGP